MMSRTREEILDSMSKRGEVDLNGWVKDIRELSTLQVQQLSDLVPVMTSLGHDEAATAMRQAAAMVKAQAAIVAKCADIISRCKFK